MAKQAQEIEVPELTLRHATTDEYCRAAQRCRHNGFWAYHDTSRIFGNYGLPFRDRTGHWWYQARAGFCWPADVFEPFPSGTRPPLGKSFLGCQHLVPDGAPCNCCLAINSIFDLPAYGVNSISDKRRAIRKGLNKCDIVVVEQVDEPLIAGALDAWNSLVQRTGWRHTLTHEQLSAKWRELLDLPATTILIARDRERGAIAGYLITKIFGDTAYVDTIASNADLLACNPNDALMYTFLRRARLIPGVMKAHYAIKSDVEPLERFKQGLGFEPTPRPANWWAPPGVKLMIRMVAPTTHRRLLGEL